MSSYYLFLEKGKGKHKKWLNFLLFWLKKSDVLVDMCRISNSMHNTDVRHCKICMHGLIIV